MVDRIQNIIRQKKLTLSGFADQIGVPRSTISHIISGRNNPSLDLVQKILDTFPDIKTEWLVRGRGPMMIQQGTLFDDQSFDDTTVHKHQHEKSTISDVKQIKNEAASTSKQDYIPQNSADNQKGVAHGTPKQTSGEDIKSTKNINEERDKASRIILLHDNGTFTEFLPSNR